MVQISPLPDTALLQVYANRPDCYTDCLSDTLPYEVSLAQFVTVFYSTKLFGLERFILKYAVNRPSTAENIATLANGSAEDFAAWSVEARRPDQLLLCDYQSRTRSWLMVQSQGDGTQLFFGSAVTPPKGRSDLGWAFSALSGVHKWYARALLRSAVRNLHTSLNIPH